MKARKLFMLGSILGFLVLLGIACAAAEETPTPTATPRAVATPTATPTPTPTGPTYGGIFTGSGSTDPTHFDMYQTTNVTERFPVVQALNTLLGADADDGELRPELAREWSISPDGLTVTLKLVEGVKWHDGKPFTSADVKYSLDRIRMPPKGMASPRKPSLSIISSIDTPDPLTVVIHVNAPNPDLLANFPGTYYAMLPKHIGEPLDQQGVFFQKGEHLVGTGPFRWKRSVPGEVHEFEKNPNYWREGLPYLDGFKYIPIRDVGAQDAALRTGRVLWHPFLGAPPIINAIRKDMGDKFIIVPGKIPVVMDLMLSINKGRTDIFRDDLELRKALSLALPRKEVAALMSEAWPILPDKMAPLIPGNPWELPLSEIQKIPGYGGDPEANKAEARRIFEKKGLLGKEPLHIMARSDFLAYRVGAPALAGLLTELGFNVDPELVDIGPFYQRANAGDHEMVLNYHLIASPTVDGNLGELTSQEDAGRNYGKSYNDELKAMFLAQSRELDPAKRKELVLEYQRRWLNQFYHILFGWSGQEEAIWAFVRGWLPRPFYQQRGEIMEQVWFDRTHASCCPGSTGL